MMKKCSEMIEERKKKNCHSRTGRFRYEMIFHSFSFFFHPFILFFLFHARFHFSGVACGSTFRTAVDVGAVWGFFSFFFRFFFLNLSLFLGVFWVCGLCDDVTIFIHSAKRLGNAAFQLRNDNKKATRFSTKDWDSTLNWIPLNWYRTFLVLTR